MGQIALGFRSLLFKLAIFVLMAALLAWALGGTLWPRAVVVDHDAVSFDGREWFRRLVVGGREKAEARWLIMVREEGGRARPFGEAEWAELTNPVAGGDAIWFGALPRLGEASDEASEAARPSATWRLERIARGGERTSIELRDRLAVERDLERVRAGLVLERAP